MRKSGKTKASANSRRPRQTGNKIRLWTEVWTFRFVSELLSEKNEQLIGECDPNTNTIQVVHGLQGRTRLDTCIHEMLHAVCPEKDELWVNSVATDMAEALWGIGYRHVKEEKSSTKSKKSPKG